MRYQGRIAAIVASMAMVACGAITSGEKPVIAAAVGCISGPTVTPSPVTLHPGDTLRLHADTIQCGFAGAVHYRWRSSDTTVGTVDSASGLIHARGQGVATIVARMLEDSVVKGAAVLQVVR
jgi:uncharacterized protein YjdB